MPLSDSPKTEKINGAIYSMSPSADYRHSIINLNIYSVLRQKLKGSLCMVFCENLDFVLHETGNYAIPDIMLICDRKQLKKGQYYGIPRFITETLSPSTAARDKQEKKKIYAEKGVDEYWIIDPFSRSIEVYHLNNQNYILQYTAILDDDPGSESYNAKQEITLYAFPNISIRLEEIFEDTVLDV